MPPSGSVPARSSAPGLSSVPAPADDATALSDGSPATAPVPGARLERTLAAIAPADPGGLAAARDRQDHLTKPPGSLGLLEEVSVRLAGLAGHCPPPMPEPAAVAVFAADHGVHAQHVSNWPQEVTTQMVANLLASGAAVNALAAQTGAEVVVVDMGVATPGPDWDTAPGRLMRHRVRGGTADMTRGPAMTRQEAVTAIEAGIAVADRLVDDGVRCLLTGDLGIANTTASAALVAAFTGADPDEVTGHGAGIDEATRRHKAGVVRTALELHRPDPRDPVAVVSAVGGLEHAAIAGFVLGAAARRVPVILDGVIATSAALVAAALCPDALSACVAGHRSAEPGHAVALRHLGLHPLIDLGLRLGEGTGAALALPLVQAAVRALRDMATFDSAGVSGQDG
ncbi:nicotinate-nucleotide--dimethylbenzimidazole phosphoribosyltransferase [Streptomyces sp. NPDC020801]|uniref:nicotinate-nucleotide--dimethylbenzimidazole phosphoribosyltransferase n=1 Tax=unclassified Streptomyces TaxID=2593676 RepID=UPI0037AA4DBD